MPNDVDALLPLVGEYWAFEAIDGSDHFPWNKALEMIPDSDTISDTIDPQDRRLAFWSGWLQAAAVLFVLQSISWIALGSFDPFGFYDSQLAQALFGRGALTAEETRLFALSNVLLGATSAGFFIMVGVLARIPLRCREPWAWGCLAGGIATWFVLDSLFSLASGAAFNVVFVNLPCLVVLALPMWGTRFVLADAKP